MEHGAWDDGWFNPEGKFNWKAIKKLEFVAEHSELKDSHLWIDQIVLTSVDTATVNDTSAFEFQVGDTTGTGDTAVHMSNVKSGCLKVFPNPAQEYITLNLQELKNFDIFDHTGRLVKTYFPVYRNKQFTTINVSSLQKGIYIINVTNSSGEFFYVKFLILK